MAAHNTEPRGEERQTTEREVASRSRAKRLAVMRGEPWPEFADEVQALSDELGMPLVHHHHGY